MQTPTPDTDGPEVRRFYRSGITGRVHSVRVPEGMRRLGGTTLHDTEAAATAEAVPLSRFPGCTACALEVGPHADH